MGLGSGLMSKHQSPNLKNLWVSVLKPSPFFVFFVPLW